jgi:hypothetical protein
MGNLARLPTDAHSARKLHLKRGSADFAHADLCDFDA